MTGADPKSFPFTTNCGPTLAEGKSCTITVTFKPAATGAQSATLQIADNAAGSPQKVTLTGTGAAAGSIVLSPTSVTFPNTQVGAESDAQIVMVTNQTTAAVSIKSISMGGANPASFVEVTDCGASLGASASCHVIIAFHPAKASALSASLIVSDSASGSPQTVALSGTGVAADSVTLSATTLAFGSVTHGTSSAAKSVTVTNHGTAILDITGITVTGTGAADFVMLTTCGATLAPAANCTIDVAFAPAGTGAQSAKVTITDSGSGSPQAISLSGTGTP